MLKIAIDLRLLYAYVPQLLAQPLIKGITNPNH